jgi:catechol 2,3-dioxygenase-like lactoylglutathione lyase family enzyme
MINNASVTPTIPVVDLERAKRFYTEKLGLQIGRDDPHHLELRAGNGSNLMLEPHEESSKGKFTLATFEVSDIEQEIRELENKGVRFEDYDEPSFKTDDHHIHQENNMRTAWFRDSEDNILCLHQRG